MTRRLRHRLGRWLLRDAPPPKLNIVGTDPGRHEMLIKIDGAALRAALLKRKRERGGGSLGLS